MMEDPEAVMVVLPADHAVSNEAKLLEALRAAMSIAAGSDLLVTVGIPPSHAHTGYGYIKRGAEIAPGAFRVDRFFEKPNLERAQKYCESGEFYWNSGMFVWKARCILDSIRQFLPDMHTALMQIGTLLGKGSRGSEDNVALIDHLFREMESISIDFGVLEHARNCAVVAAPDFGWNDVGSWDQWAEHFGHDQAGNLIHGDAVAIDSKTCVVHSQKRFTAIVGLEDVIVIDAGDALLVCARESVQDVRKVVEELKRRGRSDLV
jgi:mannose-1-phosphate guanylyltransferase